MARNSVELKVFFVACPTGDQAPGVQLISPPGMNGSGPSGELLLSMPVSAGDAHSLCHELNGDVTVRGDSLALAKRLVEALGGSIVAARLAADDALVGALEVKRQDDVLTLDVAPALAVAVATFLAVPLFADDSVIELALATRHALALSPPIAEFIQSLDLDRLDDGNAPQDKGTPA